MTDFKGQELTIGDRVIYQHPKYATLKYGKIRNIGKAKVTIVVEDTTDHWAEGDFTTRYPKTIIKDFTL